MPTEPRAGHGCPDIDGLANVRVIEHAYCGDCGRPVIWTDTGWHHDPLFASEVLA